MKTNRVILIVLLLCLFPGIQILAKGISLDPKLDSVQVYFDDQQLVLPGESFWIGIISYYKNGKIRKTVGMEGGSVWWLRYKVDVSGGTGFEGRKWIEKHNEKQIVKKPVIKKVIRKEKKKRTDAEGKEYEVEVEVEVTETVYVEEEIEVVVEVVKQGPGGDGGNGGWGGPGGLGGQGGYGGNITLYFTEDALPYKHLITARSEGGSGGMHGSGGSGGSGGIGGSGNPNGNNGRSGQSVPAAIGWADSGRSGQVRVQSTEEFFLYRSVMNQ